MSLQENVKKYITLDNQIRDLTNELKKIKNEKYIYNQRIINYIVTNNLENATIKIHDGQLNFSNQQHCQNLTYKYLESCFNKFFIDQPDISKSLLLYIKNQREIKYSKEIKRTYK